MGHERFDLVVIGSGPAGEKGATVAAYHGKRVAMVERLPVVGGTVVRTGGVVGGGRPRPLTTREI